MSRPAAYAPLSAYTRPALAKRGLWRVALIVLGFEVTFSLTPTLAAPFINWQWPDAVLTVLDYAGFGIDLAVLLVLVAALHDRGWRSLTGPGHAFRRDFGRALLAVCLVLLVQQPFDLGPDMHRMTLAPIGQWALWLIPASLAITIQVATEEVYFRGYLTQQLAAVSRRRIVWMGVPSLYFGISHLLNGDGLSDGVVYAIWAGLLGAACADLTARTGNLGAAIGLHLGNNLFAALIIGFAASPGVGLALFILPEVAPPSQTGGDEGFWAFATLLELAYAAMGVWVMWLAARVAIRA